MPVLDQETLLVDGYQVPVTNLDKIFWPEERITKGDIMEYYIKIWPFLAPHLKGRPLSLVRYPEGIDGQFFYQKNFPNAPPWVETIPIPSEERVVNYVVANNLATLIWTVNLGCIEVHPWLSRKENLDRPTYIIIDLDPMPPAAFPETIEVAQAFKTLLDHLGIVGRPKISGATGLHIYLPITPVYSFHQTSTFVKRLGEAIIRVLPHLATNERRVKERAGKVYLDHLQNLRGKTIASVYSLRPFPGAPVSIPITWEELPYAHPRSFNLRTAPDRLSSRGDLFSPLLATEQSLPLELLS